MHETGMIQALLRRALDEAEARQAKLVGIEVRLGALAGGSADHLRAHFEDAASVLGLDLKLQIEEAPMYPGGLEIIGLELADRR